MGEYKRLGDYIREVNVRNRDLKVNLSQGICNAKYFQKVLETTGFVIAAVGTFNCIKTFSNASCPTVVAYNSPILLCLVILFTVLIIPPVIHYIIF